MTIQEIENEIVEDFELFDDWTDKYQYIIELGQKLQGFPQDEYKDENKIKGCQSSVWLVTEYVDGRLIFKADSDSSIVKGLISMLVRVLDGQSPQAILDAKLDFIDRIGLQQHLAQTRANGLSSMVKQMKMYAFTFAQKIV
jgi:cysteine desulfuration protein SufE